MDSIPILDFENAMKHELKLWLVVALWGISYLVLPLGVTAMGAGAFTLLRFLTTLPILFLIMAVRRDFHMERRDWMRIALIGIVGTTGYQATFAAAVGGTTTANAAIIFSLSPVFPVLIQHAAGREKASAINGLGLALAFAGGVVMVLSNRGPVSLASEHLGGDALMLLAALLWALTAFLSEPCLKRYGGLKTTAWSLLSGVLGLGLLFGGDCMRLDWPGLPHAAWGALAFAVVGATVIGVVMFYDALPHLGTRQVMSARYLIPAVAIVCSCLVTQTMLSLPQLAGIALALCGVMLTKHQGAPASPRSLQQPSPRWQQDA